MTTVVRPGRRAWHLQRRARGLVRRTEHRSGERVVIAWQWRGGHERTVVLVHGIGMSQQYFGLLRSELAGHVDVVAIDLPGFGASPSPARAVSMAECAALVADVIRDLGAGPVIALGHSMGSQVVAELAVRHPDLVERVVLVAPTVDPRERTLRMQALRLLQDGVRYPPIVTLLGMRMYGQAGPRWFVAQSRAMLAHRIEEVAVRIEQPTLVVRGALDRVCRHDWAALVARLLPEGRLLELPGTGHEAVVTGAAPVALLIRELAS